MATVWIRSGLIEWLKGVPETRRADTPLRGRPEEGDEPLYDQETLDAAIAAEREACAKVCEKYGASLNNEWNQSLGVADDLVETCNECSEAIRARSND